MFASRLTAAGLLLLALLSLALDGKPAPPPQPPHQALAGGTTALRRDLTEQQQQPEGSSGPGNGGGGGGGRKATNAAPTPPKSKGPSASASASRLLRGLRPDGRQSRAAWKRMAHPEGGGGGGSRRPKEPAKRGQPDGCFGLKLDRIGTMSGLGC